MAISFNSDSLSTGLKKVNPSSFKGVSPKIKTFNINSAISDVTSLVKDKVSNAVNNFKNLKTGTLPEINIPKIDVSAYTEPLIGVNTDYLSSLSDIKGKLNAERLKKEINIDDQLASIDIEKISTNELSNFQGNMFDDVKLSVGDISNTQLRDFNLDASKQLEAVNNITDNVVTNAKAAAERGGTDADIVAAQTKSVDSLNELVDKKNIFI